MASGKGKGTEIANAYVKVSPQMDGFKKSVEAEIPSGSKGGEKYGTGFSGGMKGAINAGAVAVGNLLASMAQEGVAAVKGIFEDAITGFADFEQLSGGVEKIFDQADTAQIFADAAGAYEDLNMSANEYLESINQVGAAFSQTMGDQKGYDTAREGMKAISDYASGTGRDLDELNEKYSLITRSTSSYQSIADQFSGILPATSADFLAQAQAAGMLSDEYTSLTEVPVAEYQEAVTGMLQQGVEDMGLAGNTAAESAETVSGSLAALSGAWENWKAALGRDDVDLSGLTSELLKWAGTAAQNLLPRVGLIFSNLGSTAASMLQVGVTTALPQAVAGLLTVVLPAIVGMVPSVIAGAYQIVNGLITALPGLFASITAALPGLVATIGTALGQGALQVLAGATQMFDGITQAIPAILPQISAAIPGVIGAIANFLVTYGPAIMQGAVQMLGHIVQAIPVVVPQVLAGLSSLVSSLLQSIVTYGPSILMAAVQMLGGLIQALPVIIPQLLMGIAVTLGQLVNFFASNTGAMLAAGTQLFAEILKALGNVAPQVINALVYFVTHLPEILVSGIGALADGAAQLFGGFVDGILGKEPEADEAASSLAKSAADSASTSADASAAGQSITDSMMEGFDFDALAADTSASISAMTADAAAAADGTQIATNLTSTASLGLDQSALDTPAESMATNAVAAAKTVDAAEIGRSFSESAASGIDTSAMAAKAAEMASAASGNLNTTSTVSVKADLTGVNQLKAAAGTVTSSMRSMQGAASASMRGISSAASAAASSSAGSFRSLASSVSGSMSSMAGSASRAAASVRGSLATVQSKTVTISVAPGHVSLPYFTMSGKFDPKTGAVPSVSVRWYAKGGLFTQPAIIGVGEGKEPEGVFPLSKLEAMLGQKSNGSDGVNVTLNYTGSADPDELVRTLSREMRMLKLTGAI